jgi:hypothetical protein
VYIHCIFDSLYSHSQRNILDYIRASGIEWTAAPEIIKCDDVIPTQSRVGSIMCEARTASKALETPSKNDV